jgi:hypothetical protein
LNLSVAPCFSGKRPSILQRLLQAPELPVTQRQKIVHKPACRFVGRIVCAQHFERLDEVVIDVNPAPCRWIGYATRIEVRSQRFNDILRRHGCQRSQSFHHAMLPLNDAVRLPKGPANAARKPFVFE